MDEAPEERLQTLVDTFRLAVGLGVVCQAHRQHGLGETEEFTPQHTSEDAVAITDDGGRQTMEAIYVVEEGLCDLLSTEWV
jgi:hypothetical protein